MVHVVLLAISGLFLCGGMTLLADRFASEFFRKPGEERVNRSLEGEQHTAHGFRTRDDRLPAVTR